MSAPIASPVLLAGAWTGLLLAGGRSTRMGQDKARLPFAGHSLLAELRRRLLAAGASAVLVSGDYPEFAGIPDRQPDLGPLGGLASVLPTVADAQLLVLAVDMPQVDGELLAALLAAVDAAAVVYAGHPLPMRLRLDARSRAAVQALLQAPPRQRSLHALQRMLGAHVIECPPQLRARLVNCNTPEQWQEATHESAT